MGYRKIKLRCAAMPEVAACRATVPISWSCWSCWYCVIRTVFWFYAYSKWPFFFLARVVDLNSWKLSAIAKECWTHSLSFQSCTSRACPYMCISAHACAMRLYGVEGGGGMSTQICPCKCKFCWLHSYLRNHARSVNIIDHSLFRSLERLYSGSHLFYAKLCLIL